MAKEPKDFWDKFSIITTVLTAAAAGILLPLVIFILGHQFNENQRQAEYARLRQQEKNDSAHRNADRAAQLLTHLASSNARERCLALMFANNLIKIEMFPEELSALDLILNAVNDESDEVYHCASHSLEEAVKASPRIEQSLKTELEINPVVQKTVKRATNINPKLLKVFKMKVKDE